MSAVSEDEILKIREQVREFENKRFGIATEKFAEQIHQGRENARSYSNQYAQSVLRTVFLLNGGSIVALLTLIGSMFPKSETKTRNHATHLAIRVSGFVIRVL